MDFATKKCIFLHKKNNRETIYTAVCSQGRGIGEGNWQWVWDRRGSRRHGWPGEGWVRFRGAETENPKTSTSEAPKAPNRDAVGVDGGWDGGFPLRNRL